MRAALYARVSSEEQVEGYSIDAQRRAFKTLVEGKGWTIYGEYIEEGKSARTENINRRPAFKEMVGNALARKFDILIVHKLDRFSRNLRITLEYFDKLSKAGVTFLSINEQIDFSTPWGTLALTLLGGLAQFYSDNLSQETKKGWHERRAQGLYCGLLPFGTMKGEDGVPVPHPNTYPGLMMAFELAAQGKSDKEVAQALNAAGYRTAGNRGPQPFSRDTARGMLTNKFYLGYLPNGNGGWIKAKHGPFINEELWNQAQQARERNRKTRIRIPKGRSISSLTGLAFCVYCKGRINIIEVVNGRRRVACYNRSKGWECPQKSAYLDIYEDQISEYLRSFRIPEDYREKILDAHRKLRDAYDDTDNQRARLEARLQRMKELYGWGDITRDQYLAEREAIHNEVKALAPIEEKSKNLDKLAQFLGNVAHAWDEANQEQRNKLARCLFQEVWIKDKEVVAVKPQPELKPFFDLNYETMQEKLSQDFGKWRPRRDLNP
jgi:site-specific DNA recombinase